MSADIARHYDASKDDGGFVPGVPLADIDHATFDSYPAHVQEAIDGAAMYRKTKPSNASAKAPAKADAPADAGKE